MRENLQSHFENYRALFQIMPQAMALACISTLIGAVVTGYTVGQCQVLGL